MLRSNFVVVFSTYRSVVYYRYTLTYLFERSVLMKAWRERWTDSQFGTHVGHFFNLLLNPVLGILSYAPNLICFTAFL